MPAELTRTVTLDLARADAGARTVAASLSSEAPVQRGYGSEVLEHTPAAIDLSRAEGGLPLLFAHDHTLPIGIIEGVRLEGRRLVGLLRFGASARAAEIWHDVVAGVLKHISISYRIAEEKSVPGGIVATRWTPYEASLVSVPGDHTVGIGRSIDPIPGASMNTTTAAPAAADPAEVRHLARGLPEDFINGVLATGASGDQARAAITAELARRDAAAGGHRNIAPSGHFLARAAGNIDQAREQMITALRVGRFGSRGDVSGNPYMHARAIDMGRDLLELRGVRTTGLSPTEIIQRAITSGDLPNLFSATGHRSLQDAFAAYTDGIHRAAKQSSIADFRAKTAVRFSEAPELLLTNEHGEFKHGAVAESAESYRLLTYGRIVSLTRQAIINDDLSALERMPAMFARAANDRRATLLVAQFALNSGAGPVMQDGSPCFHINHANLATGAGSALQTSALVAARKAMRLQKDIGGRTLLDLVPAYLIVPATLEHAAQQLLADISPASVDDVNAAGRGLSLIVEPRLDALSLTAWYLASDPAAGGLEYSYLQGDQGPVFEQEAGFEVDGMSFKCRLDIGAAITEFRTLFKAAGA